MSSLFSLYHSVRTIPMWQDIWFINCYFVIGFKWKDDGKQVIAMQSGWVNSFHPPPTERISHRFTQMERGGNSVTVTEVSSVIMKCWLKYMAPGHTTQSNFLTLVTLLSWTSELWSNNSVGHLSEFRLHNSVGLLCTVYCTVDSIESCFWSRGEGHIPYQEHSLKLWLLYCLTFTLYWLVTGLRVNHIWSHIAQSVLQSRFLSHLFWPSSQFWANYQHVK